MSIIALIATYNCYSFLSSIRKDEQEKNDFWRITKAKHAPKNFIQKKSFERPYSGIVNENAYISSNQTYIYHSFKEFFGRVSKLKTLDDWNFTLLFDRILIQFFTKPITLPQLEIIVDDSLAFLFPYTVGFFLKLICCIIIIEGQFEMSIS